MAAPHNENGVLVQMKLTPRLIEQFVYFVRKGNYYTTTCALLNITPQSFRRWMREGEKTEDDNNLYRRFSIAVRQAEAEMEMEALDSWRAQFYKNFAASRDFLAVRFPEKWADKKKIMVHFEAEVDKMLRHLSQRLDSDMYEAVHRTVHEILEERTQHLITGSTDAGSLDTEFSMMNAPDPMPPNG